MFVGKQDISVQIIQLCPLCKLALLFTIISIGRSYPEVVGSNPTEVKFSLTRGDSQISFKGVIPKGDLVYRQYCLLPTPKHTLKIIISC